MAGAEARDGRPPRTRVRRAAVWAGRILLLLIALPVAAAAILVGRVWFGQPMLDGTRQLAGIDGEVRIARDARGVVHIDAGGEDDLYFGLGYAHAQDRFFQMEAMRRIAAGRLSEIVGAPALGFDTRMRVLGVGRLAAGDVDALSPAARRAYEAYAAGVNAWLASRRGVAADELALLLAPEPEAWRPEHSLAWNRLMSLRLVGNWASELMRLGLARRLTPAQLADLWPDYPPDGPVSFPDLPADLIERAAEFARLANRDDGSNGWAISAELSQTGGALLANDPHLGLTTPGTWHLVSLTAPGFRLAGATAPGVPAVVLGHNGRAAWGLTNATTDTSDVYVERLDPDDPARYLTPDGPRAFETRTERIEVRFGETQEIAVRATRHGPVISDGRDTAPAGAVLALAHTGLMPREGSAEAIFQVNRADSWPEFRAALKQANAPQQNAFYAGPDGVALATMALAPIRVAGDGYMPADGATRAGDWASLADVEAMPQVFRPARSWAANANNRLAGDDYPIWLGREWGYAGRMARIEARLDAGGPFDLDAMQRLQYDGVSPIAREVLPDMLAALPQDLPAPLADLARRLRAWDMDTPRHAPEPLIFYAWMREAIRAVFRDELGPDFAEWFSLRAEPFALALRERPVWCDDVGTDAVEDCSEVLESALTAARAWIATRHGDDVDDWRWDSEHRARFRHLGFGFVPVLRDIFDVVLPTPGGQETVNRAAFRIGDEAAPFAQGHGPGLRALYDLADLERSRFIIAPGQSGRLFSPNRSNLAADWRDGRYATLTPPAEPVHLLVLKPRDRP